MKRRVAERGSMVMAVLTTLLVSGSTGFAADLPGFGVEPVQALSPAFIWTGFYFGANAGYVADRSSIHGRSGLFGPYLGGPDYSGYGISDGFTGGGQLGYNHQFGAGSGVVVGLETDFDYTDISRDRSSPAVGPFGVMNAHYRTSLDGIGTIRGRLGYGIGPLLAFGTGGFAYDIADRQAGLTTPGGIDLMRLDLKDVDTGYVVGGGVEYALPQGLMSNLIGSGTMTVKAEYLHADLGQDAVPITITGQSFTAHLHSAVDMARAGVNYKF